MIAIKCESIEDAVAVLRNTVWSMMYKGETLQVWVKYSMSVTCACLNDPKIEAADAYLDMQCVVRKYEDHKEAENWVFDMPDDAADFLESLEVRQN